MICGQPTKEETHTLLSEISAIITFLRSNGECQEFPIFHISANFEWSAYLKKKAIFQKSVRTACLAVLAN